MRRTLVVFLLLSLYFPALSALKITPRFKLTYMTFNLSSLKTLQEDLYYDFLSSGINVKKFDNYPQTVSYQLQFMTETPKFTMGISGGFATTGSRMDYRDYTGNYTMDQILNHFSLGIILERAPLPKRNSRLVQYLNLSLIIDQFKIREELTVFGDELVGTTTDFYARGYGLETGFRYIVLKKPILVMLSIGFQAVFSETFRLADDVRVELYSSKGAVRPSWNGLRMGLILSL